MPKTVSLSEKAVQRIIYLRKHEGDESLMFRVTVNGGGCSGFQYSFSFDTARSEADHVFEHFPVRLVIDEMSLDLMNGSIVDYVEDLIGASFQVKNPNAASSCGCGTSFSV